MSNTGIPIPGTPAYWAAQREAVALVSAWQNDAWRNGRLIPAEELALLRCIAAHRLAARMMAALGHDVDRLTMAVLRMPGLFEEDVDEGGDGEDEDADPDAPPHGADWCERGCQILHGMECGVCGYEGRGVRTDQVRTVAEHCCHCNARTYQSPDGICELCGKDAETPDEPAPPSAACFWDCGPVSQDTQCSLCRDLERHARQPATQVGDRGRSLPPHVGDGQL